MSTLALLLLLAVAAEGGAPPVAVLEPAKLMDLEARGFAVGAVAFHLRDARSNADLARSRTYQDVVDTLGADLRELYASDKAWGPGMRFTHRGFDLSWLTSPDARWDLVAVMNRVDRRAFLPGTCGELRLIYRLAYTTETKRGAFSSRLPATMNVVFILPDDGASCSRMATSLGAEPPVADLALKSVEVNVQTARWPSTVRPDLGGHADYVLRVFHEEGGRLVPAPLENTPDVEKLARDPARKKALAQWIKDHAKEIDLGVAIAPDEVLATRAVSVTPRGLARAANRPWTRLFEGSDLDKATLRRLDGLSCMGCHQSRSVAGFHVVGAERDPSRTVDALAIPVSPHVEDELARRSRYAIALVRREPVDERRPPAERAAGSLAGTFGDACGLDAAFSSWTCAPTLVCTPVDDDVVGQCMPRQPVAGAACKPGVVDFRSDRIASAKETPCRTGDVCEDVDVGFPGGMCAGSCEGLDESAAHARCGGIAILTPFNECLARGELFSTCARHARPAALRACGRADPCRPDYLCAHGEGGDVCLPPYFVLQMRVDGHPKLKKR
jgi:hypothetical protein